MGLWAAAVRDAEQITHHGRDFLHKTLKLELSQDQTLIAHARTHAARYLRHGKPTHLPARRHETASRRVTRSQAAYRGGVQYA